MPIRQSFSWWCFAGRGVPDGELLAKAKSIGYQAVELVPADLFQPALDAGLAIASHPGHPLEADGLNDPACHDKIEQTVLKNLESAVKYQIPNLIVFSGERVKGITDEQGIEASAKGLARLAKPAEQAGVNLCIELLNSRVDHARYMCDRTDWGVEVCKRVASPRVKLLYDIYHMQIMEGDIIRTIRNNHAYFSHYHTAGNPGRNDMDDTQELLYPPIMRAIAETGYDGFVGHEFVPKADTLKALEAAFRLCDV